MLARCLPVAWVAAAALLCAAAPARTQGVPLPDAELSQVWGQALLELTNTQVNGFDFSRITLNADISLSANLSGLRLGEYAITDPSKRNGTGADIDLGRLQFGRSDAGDALRTVAITDPYFEFVYKNAADASKREVVGMRLGFGGIKGDLGVQINALSGSLRIDLGAQGVIDSGNDAQGGKRWDGTSCGSSACAVALSQLGLLTAGDANGASRDFFISVLKQSVQFPSVNGVITPEAAAGFWLNWRDRLYGSTQGMPANLPKPPGGG
jgi:hypothetical protein